MKTRRGWGVLRWVAPALLLGGLAAHGEPGQPAPGTAVALARGSSSAEPTAEMLAAVDGAWERNGWQAVVPHAYVLRTLAPVRERPEEGAPVAFWLKGGTRVPVLEQGRSWWRVSWTGGRSGWIPVKDLEPHASVVLIDARTGRVERRLAVKGQWGALSDGQSLWSLSNSGLTRMVLGERPAFWANPVRHERDAVLSGESVWTPDHGMLFLRPEGENTSKVLSASLRTGVVRPAGEPGDGQMVRADAEGRVLLTQQGEEGKAGSTWLYDPRQGKVVARVAGWALAATRNGPIYVQRGQELVVCDAALKPGAKVRFPQAVDAVCVSPDEAVVAVSYSSSSGEDSHMVVEVRRAGTLAKVATLATRGEERYTTAVGIAGGPGGWTALLSAEGPGVSCVRFNARGRRLRGWTSDGPWAMRPDGGEVTLTRGSEMLAVNVADGQARRIPLSWRRPLPARYLPKPSDPSVKTHLDVSELSFTPDGRTLILTEWLNGDPAG